MASSCEEGNAELLLQPSSTNMTNDFKKVLCQICQKEAARYTCPRCNTRYCSSDCYKGQGHMQCSEAFYRDCFMQGLNDCQVGASERQEMLAMLSRLEDENPLDSDDDSDDEEDLADRIAGLDLDSDTDQIWERLTAKEREEFKVMLREGQLGGQIQPWQPWWLNEKKLVEVQDVSGEGQSSPVPAIMSRVPQFSQLSKKEPSAFVKFTVINLLYGYAYITRLHNGDHRDNALQAAQELTELCCGFTNQPLSSTAEALTSCVSRLQQNKELFQSREFSVAVVQDVQKILEGGHGAHTVAALSDLHQLLTAARKGASQELKSIKDESPAAKELAGLKKTYFNCVKKVEYLLAWCGSYGLELAQCVPEVELEFCSLSSDLVTQRKTQEKVEQSMSKLQPRKHKLIEEIS